MTDMPPNCVLETSKKHTENMEEKSESKTKDDTSTQEQNSVSAHSDVKDVSDTPYDKPCDKISILESSNTLDGVGTNEQTILSTIENKPPSILKPRRKKFSYKQLMKDQMTSKKTEAEQKQKPTVVGGGVFAKIDKI